MNLPPAFRARMQQQLGEEYADFEAALQQLPPVSVRRHPHKPTAQFAACERVAWCAEGYYLAARPSFALDPLWHAGAYYVQEAASMWIAAAVQQHLDLTQPLRVLDLCAAPGGKTTLLASLLHPDSLLVANEVIQRRVSVLKENMVRWGFPNIVIANHDPADFAPLTDFFDLILVDAPCSGEGLFRKDADSVNEWSLESVRLCGARQQRILAAAVPLLKPNGVLLYSTCTYNTTENDDNAEWLCAAHGLQPLPMHTTPILPFLPVARGIGYQCMPHQIKGEGFYFAALRKAPLSPTEAEEAEIKKNLHFTPSKKSFKNISLKFKNAELLPATASAAFAPYMREVAAYDFYQKPNNEVFALRKTLIDSYWQIDQALQRKQLGSRVGELLARNMFVPAHDLAMSPSLLGEVPTIDLAEAEALAYLRKANFELPDLPNRPHGWAVVAYMGCALGWIKVLPNRFNNYLPSEWRLRLR